MMVATQTPAERWPSMPTRMRKLPVDHREFPVPWFVAFIDGEPDFRVIGPGRIVDAVNQRRCWLCGETLGVNIAFVIGPMCAINRVTSEPGCHLECARFATLACPFLTKPNMRRNEKDYPTEAQDPAGIFIKRNPGVTLIWVTRTFGKMRAGAGVLFTLGEPEHLEWWTRGRTATREEVAESIATGLPLPANVAQEQGPEAIAMLNAQIRRGMLLLPPA